MPPPLICRRINNVRIRRIDRHIHHARVLADRQRRLPRLSRRQSSYKARDPRPPPTTAPPPPHTPPSNLADRPPPAQYDPTSSLPNSSNSSRHPPSGKSRRHKPRCAGNCSRPSPPTPPTDHSDRAPPNQSNTKPLYRTPESTSSHHSPSSKPRPKPRPRNTQTCSSDSPQSTSPAPKPPPAQSTETPGQKKCRPSSHAFFSSLFLFRRSLGLILLLVFLRRFFFAAAGAGTAVLSESCEAAIKVENVRKGQQREQPRGEISQELQSKVFQNRYVYSIAASLRSTIFAVLPCHLERRLRFAIAKHNIFKAGGNARLFYARFHQLVRLLDFCACGD